MRRLFRDEEGSTGVWLRLLQTAPLGHGLPPLPLRNSPSEGLSERLPSQAVVLSKAFE